MLRNTNYQQIQKNPFPISLSGQFTKLMLLRQHKEIILCDLNAQLTCLSGVVLIRAKVFLTQNLTNNKGLCRAQTAFAEKFRFYSQIDRKLLQIISLDQDSESFFLFIWTAENFQKYPHFKYKVLYKAIAYCEKM